MIRIVYMVTTGFSVQLSNISSGRYLTEPFNSCEVTPKFNFKILNKDGCIRLLLVQTMHLCLSFTSFKIKKHVSLKLGLPKT